MKAIILTAGLGTRFLPMTKTVPKAMLPILNKPVIQMLVEEAVESGITDIAISMSPGSEAIEAHFSKNHSLQAELERRGKADWLNDLDSLIDKVNLFFTVQEEAKGDGHAILSAKAFLEGGPFAVLFGDDLIEGPKPALRQLLDEHEAHQMPVICTQKVPMDQISNYGVVAPGSVEGRRIHVDGLIEKPSREEAPSDIGIVGKYVCTAETLDYLEKARAGHKDGEIRLIDGFRAMLEDGKQVAAFEIEGERFDTGRPEGLLKAKIAYAKKSGLI